MVSRMNYAKKGCKEMAIDLSVMRRRLEKKQAEIQRHIAALTGSPTLPEDAIQASDGVVEPEEEAVDLEDVARQSTTGVGAHREWDLWYLYQLRAAHP